jgi:hypothetical protein
MVGTVRPDSGGTETGRGRELAERSDSNPNTATPPAQDPNSGPLLRREQFPRLSDDQWRERRAVLRRSARERTCNRVAVTFGGSVVDFQKPPRFRWKRKS